MVLTVKRDPSGAETTVVTARSPLLDLTNGVIQRTEEDGTVTLLYTLLGFTLDELVEEILDDAPAIFSKGKIEDPTLIIDVFTFDLDNPLSALQELATLAGQELAIRRDGDSGFLVDIVEQAGAFDTYGEIRCTVTDDMLMGESAPTTNFGGGVVFSVQRGPGGTDTTNGLKFDLRWLRGLPVRIIDARLVLTGNGVGGGTSHVVTLTPLRSATSGPFTGQPREIREFETTWDDHITGRAWGGGGARATNDDRDDAGAGAWSATRADNTVAGETIDFDGFSSTSVLLEDFLQTVVDGTDAFFKDGLARFVFDADASGQSGKVGQYHTDDSLTVSARPQLLLTLAQDTPHFVFQRNLIGINRETDERDLVNRLFAVGGGGPSEGIRLTLGKARWTVATVPTTTTFTITETAIFENTHLEGNFVDPLDGSGPFLITATIASTQLVTTSVAHGLSVGDVFAFRLNATPDELVYVESPSSQVNYGIVRGTQTENDLPIVDNLVANAALRDFTAGSPDNWTALGGAVLSQETDPLHTQIAGSAAKVVTGATVGDGIQSDAITLAPVGSQVFFSAQLFLFVESGGGVDVFLEHSVDGRFPLEGSDEAAFTTEDGIFIEVSIEGVEFGPGLLTLNIVNREATAGVFYLDGAQLINLAQAQPFFETRSSTQLWQRGLDTLTLKSVPKITHRLPQALDLTGIDDSVFPYDQVVLGGDVFVDDRRLGIDDLVTRVVKLRTELLQSAVLRMELTNSLDTLTDQLAARERRTRQAEPEPPPKQGFQAVTLSVIDTGEVLVAVTGGKRMRSYKFLVKLDSPETFDAVVAAGTVSDVIDGSAVFTGFFMETGDLAFLRAVAYKGVSGGGVPGATEVRAVSLTPGTTSLVRARIEFLADHTQLTASPAAALPWDVEVYDVGNLHNSSDPELLTAPISGQYLLIYAIAWAASAGAGDRRQGILEGGPSAIDQPGGSIDYNKPGLHTGLSFALDMQGSPSREYEAEVHNTTGADITIFSADSFFQAIRIAVRSDQHRVWVESTIHSIADATDTVVSFSLASDDEIVDVGAMFDKGGAPTRITFNRSVPYLVIVTGVWQGQGAGVGTTALRRTDLRLNGTTRFARGEFQELDALASADLFAQPVAKFIEPTAADFMEVLVRQESGAAITWGSRLNALGQATGLWQAFELPGGLNPRASVSLSANELIATATPTAIPWDNEDTDVDAMVDIGGAPTRITINTGGLYLLIAQIAWAGAATGIRRIAIKQGASVDRATREIDDPDGTFTATVMVAMPADIGDFFEVEVEQASGGGLNVLSADSFFQAIRIGNL